MPTNRQKKSLTWNWRNKKELKLKSCKHKGKTIINGNYDLVCLECGMVLYDSRRG